MPRNHAGGRDRVADSERLRLVIDALPALAAFVDPGHCYTLANRSHFAWFGLEPASLGGRPLHEVIGEGAYRVLEPLFRDAEAGGRSAYAGRVSFERGGARFVHCTVTKEIDGQGAVAGFFLLMTDLTEQKLIERALDDATLRARTVLDTAVDGIITIDENGVVESFNPGAERQFGYRADEIIGRNVSLLMPAMHAERHDGYLRRYVETGERHIIGIGREVNALRKDGVEFPIDLAVGEFVENGRRYFTGFTRDISARRAAENEARARRDELAHVMRLSSMGELASGIAHEINQPLTAVITMSHALLRMLRSNSADQAAVEQILGRVVEQGERASSIIQHMREFIAKGTLGATGMHDPNALVQNVLNLMSHEIAQHDIGVGSDLDPGVPAIRVNRVQIEQVILNLIQNAVQALAASEGHRDRVLTVRSRAHRDSVEIQVIDNGIGLPPAGEERVFEAFFTTRKEGMGQGLSISRSIVEAHGGTIRASRHPGSGSIFTFTLPIGEDGRS